MRSEHNVPWYPLDNAARIFPSVASSDFPTVFRLSATFREPVSLPVVLQVSATLAKRFPYYRVVLRRGLFWYYLEERNGPFPVEADLTAPCTTVPGVRSNPELLRILVRGNRIAVEASHILTDGGGLREFFRVLLVEYIAVLLDPSALDGTLRRAAAERGIMVATQQPGEGETDYSYRRYYTPNLPPPVATLPAWHLPGVRVAAGHYHVTTLVYRIADLKVTAHRHGVGMTAFAIAVFLYALQRQQVLLAEGKRRRKGKRRPLRILVPIDLRNAEGSRTMRNFFVFLLAELDIRLGWYDLGEIALKVHHQIGAEMDPRNLRRHVTRNVKPERNTLVRLIPIHLKDCILRAAYRRNGERVNTASFSNLMSVDLPDEVEREVAHVDFVPPRSPVTGINATMIGCGEAVTLTFGSTLRNHDVERLVAETLHGVGLSGSVITNWGWNDGVL